MVNDALNNLISTQIQAIRKSKKYTGLGIPEETLLDIISVELKNHPNSREAEKSIRHKLHNMIAPYLGDPDYQTSAQEMTGVFSKGIKQDIESFCISTLNKHASSRERMPILSDFYSGIFNHTGKPNTVLDLACGLNPFSLPWMKLDPTIKYYAYDIHRPRIELINQFFQAMGVEPLAELRDILVNPPQIKADVAFLFKEAHRLEQRRRGCNKVLWQQLQVRYILVSLPASSLSGHYDLMERQRYLVHSIIENEPWTMIEMCFGNEMVFCIEKNT